jgi:quercetin dioxygenase-like cupin family protein
MTTSKLRHELSLWCLALTIGFVAGAAFMHRVDAQPQPIKAVRLMQDDLTGVAGKEVVMTVMDLQPGAGFPAHRHYGDEFVFVIDGAYARFVEDRQSVAKAGEAFHIERERVHGGKASGSTPTRLLTLHVVDKGKPFAERIGAN